MNQEPESNAGWAGRLFPATVMPDRDWWRALWPDPRAVLQAVGVRPGMSVVDLCCGDGHFTAPICDLVGGGRVFGLDLDPELLAMTEAACAAYPAFSARLADARDFDRVIDEPVDHVFIANTFHGVPEQTGLAVAVVRALMPGGRFSVVNWYPRPREETPVLGQPRGPDLALRMPPEAVAEVVEPAGLRLERVVQVGRYHYGAVFLKP